MGRPDGAQDNKADRHAPEQSAAQGADAPVERERFTYFWKSDSPFSQWYEGLTFESEDRRYVTAEQYMMVGKALLFGDVHMAARILSSTSPRQQKALGRKVAGFDERLWKENRERIVLDGNRAKFAANPEARTALLATAGTTLVEASPLDTVWGVGLDSSDPRARRRATWRGLNLLGKVLTQLRGELLAEQAQLEMPQTGDEAGPGGGEGTGT